MLTEELVTRAKSYLNGKNGSREPFEAYLIGKNQALLVLTEYGLENFPRLQEFYKGQNRNKLRESDFEKALISSNVPFMVAQSQKRLYMTAPSKNYPLDAFSGENVPTRKEYYLTQYWENCKDFENGNQIIKNRHPGKRKLSSRKNASKVRITFDLLYHVQNEGSGAEYLLGEIKAYPYTDKSKIERRAGQITTYGLCLGQIGGCNDIAFILPTLPSNMELERYLNEPAQDNHSLHILTITERDYLSKDIKKRISSAKRNIGRHPDKGWEKEAEYLEEIAEIAGLVKD